MKRYFFTLFFAAFFLISCEQNDLEESSSTGSLISIFSFEQSPGVTVDIQAPTVTQFLLSSSTPTTDPVVTFTLAGTDDTGITAWMITTDATQPLPGDSSWSAAQPGSYTITTGYATYTLYAWARDAAGNVSSAVTDNSYFTIDYEDTSAPYITLFGTGTNPTDNPTISFSTFNDGDDVGITGWMITVDNPTAPLATDSGWETTRPASYSISTGYGTYELYAWAKDLAGNVSSMVTGSHFTIVYQDLTVPTITQFDRTSSNPTVSTTITFDLAGTDNEAVTAWLITETATTPDAADTGWSATLPVSYTLASATYGTTYTLYAWAKDAAQNVGGGSNFSVYYGDITAPVVNTFAASGSNPTIDPIIPFTLSASDNFGIIQWNIKVNDATQPTLADADWVTSEPTSYTLTTGAYGTYEIYIWVRDLVGNINALTTSSHFNVTYDDTDAPVISAFSGTGPNPTINPVIPFTLSGTDNVGITGWMITLTATAPLATDSGWSSTLPASHTLSTPVFGVTYTLHAWAKDLAGNVSAAGTSFNVVYDDQEAPVVSQFVTVPSGMVSTKNATVTVSITASDNVAVTGYMITETDTQPASTDSGWLASAPTSHTFSSTYGNYKFYAWAKDGEGNVSNALTDNSWFAITYLPTSYIHETGQTSCYDSAGAAVACAGTGQDGEFLAGISWPTTRFTDNLDGTITDNLTGLIWTADARLMASTYASYDNDGTAGDGRTDWDSALAFAAQLRTDAYAGRTDWRIPNILELKSLMNYGVSSTATWLQSYGFTNVGMYYWSSTTYTAYDNTTAHAQAWPVAFSTGQKYATTKSTIFYVWAVAGATTLLPKTGQTACYDSSGALLASCSGTGQDGEYQAGIAIPDPRFTINGDGTTTDNLTSLMWTTNLNLMAAINPSFDGDQTIEDGQVYWENALAFVDYLNSINYAGYTDWRLPNINELSSLEQYGMTTSQFSTGFTNYGLQCHWSSTTVMTDTSIAFLMNVPFGNEFTSFEKTGVVNAARYVWPVRGGY